MSDEYLIGQRVIYSGEICIVLESKPKDWRIWIERYDGVQQRVSPDNVKPLPEVQL